MLVRNKTSTALGAIAGVALSTSAPAVVLFADNFDRADASFTGGGAILPRIKICEKEGWLFAASLLYHWRSK